MARDRKRAKQRQARRARDGARIAPSGVPLRGDVPAALDHASGDVDEFDAALIRGAQGVPAADEPEVATNGSEPPEDGAEAREEDGPDADAEGSTTTEVAPPEPSDAGESEPAGDWESEPPGEPDGQELPERAAEPSHASPAEALEDEHEQEDQSEEEDEEKRGPAVRRAPAAPAERRRGIYRAIAFLRASWAELHRVQWPDRRQVTQATAVVLGFVAVAGVYLGLADLVAKSIVEAIL